MGRLGTLFGELRRRKVIRTAIVYAALAWVAIQVVTTLLPVFGGRETVVRIVVTVILLGLPAAIVVSWLFDFTPTGFRRDLGPAVDDDAVPSTPAREPDRIFRPPPAPATPLVGREAEVAEVVDLLGSGARVVTVAGPGGTGKTRLAIAATDRARASFPDGFAWIDLSAVTDPVAVIPTIAGELGVKEAETRSLAAGLATVIGDRRVLLVLDNVEQVIEAAPDLAGLIASCPALSLLTTSRAPLRIAGEVEYPLRPLALPPAGRAVSFEDLETYPAIELFLDRARRARADFRLTAANADAVLGICRRLDGLPLALELAAARLRTLEPDSLLRKLEHALDLLTSGARDLPSRQRTLRSTIDWSHSLLDGREQRLFRRLAVFAGGWPGDAVGPVCYEGEEDGSPGGRSLDALESLVEQGLVLRLEGAARFGMLETIREYAIERLYESGDEARLRRRHAAYFRALVERAYEDFRGGAQVESLERTDLDGANIEEALSHLHEAGLAGDDEAAEHGLRMCGDLWMYWHVRGLHIRAREWSHRFLTLPAAQAVPGARARALLAAAIASMTLGDLPGALAACDEAEPLARGRDPEAAAMHAVAAGVCHLIPGAMDPARQRLEEAVRRGRTLDRPWELAIALSFLGLVEAATGNVDAARAILEEALALQRPIGDHEGMGGSLSGLAALEAAAGRPDAAIALYREAFDAYHAIGDRPEEARILDALAWTHLAMGETREAQDRFAGSLRAYEEVGSVRGIGIALLGFAATQAAEDRPDRAVRIAAAAAMFSEQEGVANDYFRDTSAPRYLDAARERLAPAELARLEAEGRAMSVREAARYALEPAALEVPAA